MVIYSYDPDYAVAPGETLLETIEALGFGQSELADRTGLSLKHVNQIISGEAAISTSTAISLGRVTGVAASMWIQLESRYREMLKRQESQAALKADLKWLKSISALALIERGQQEAINEEQSCQ